MGNIIYFDEAPERWSMAYSGPPKTSIIDAYNQYITTMTRRTHMEKVLSEPIIVYNKEGDTEIVARISYDGKSKFVSPDVFNLREHDSLEALLRAYSYDREPNTAKLRKSRLEFKSRLDKMVQDKGYKWNTVTYNGNCCELVNSFGARVAGITRVGPDTMGYTIYLGTNMITGVTKTHDQAEQICEEFFL
jgi:hypothetical protein